MRPGCTATRSAPCRLGVCPRRFLEDAPDALRVLVARHARTHGPFRTDDAAPRPLPPRRLRRPARVERTGQLVRESCVLAAASESGAMWRSCVASDGASLAALRKEIEPADQRALAAFLPSWQGVDRHSGAGAGVDRLREVLVPLQGLALPVEIWECDVLPRRIGAYSQTWLDNLCASGELVWVGAGSIGRSSGRVALYFREDASLIGALPRHARAPRLPLQVLPSTTCCASDSRRDQPSSLHPLVELDIAGEALREALWYLVWAGEATNDAWAPLRAPHLTLARGGRAARGGESPFAVAGRGESPRPAAGAGSAAAAGRSMTGRSRFGTRRRGAQAQVQGRLVADRVAVRQLFLLLLLLLLLLLPPMLVVVVAARSSPAPLPSPERRRALAELLLERYGIVTREQVLAEGYQRWFCVVRLVCEIGRTWACAAGATSSRGWAARSSRCRARSSVCVLATC